MKQCKVRVQGERHINAQGMIEKAILDFPEIEVKNSYLIGDSLSDIQAGKEAGLHTVKVDDKFTLYDWAEQINAC